VDYRVLDTHTFPAVRHQPLEAEVHVSNRIPKGSAVVLGAVAMSFVTMAWIQQQVVPDRNGPPVPQPQITVEHGVTCGPVEGDRRANIPDSATSWANWEVPEYQDRQAFIRRTDGAYGPVACVVAADRIDTFTIAHFSRPEGALVAIVFVDGDPRGDASYVNLRLSAGYNCVFLKLLQSGGRGGGYDQVRFDRTGATGEKGPPAATQWRGYVVKSLDRSCTFDETKTVRGHRVIPVDLATGDVPAAARFMLKSDGTPGIGIRCLEAWCVVGLRQSELQRVIHSIPGAGPEKARRLVFGWYDDQILALPNPTGGPIRPGNRLRATIIPDPGLSHYTMATDFRNGVEVAKVRFEGTPVGKYSSVWHFLPRKDNTIRLKHIPPYGAMNWQVMINDTIREGLSARYTKHGSDAFLASTARWSWKSTDEGGWVRCDDGCCEIQPTGTGWGLAAAAGAAPALRSSVKPK
jgi:hypothetical protein